MRRSELRENIFLLLFRKDFYNMDEMSWQSDMFFDNLGDIDEASKKYIHDRTFEIISKLEEIDEKINEVSKGWKIERMGKVDLSILRLGSFEILYDEDIPVNVAINEAVELAKKYGTDESYSFINGILGKLVQG